MKTTAQQRAAAYRRHARTSEARTLFYAELSKTFPSSAHRHNIAGFASSHRRLADQHASTLNQAFGLKLRPSTLCTWLRAWRKSFSVV
jgi:hypothetical protein